MAYAIKRLAGAKPSAAQKEIRRKASCGLLIPSKKVHFRWSLDTEIGNWEKKNERVP